MKNIKILLIIAIVLTSYQKSSAQVNVKAIMPGLKSGTWIYYGLSGSFAKRRDSVQASANGFALTLPVNDANDSYYCFVIGDRLKGTDVTSKEFYLTEGEFNIKTTGPDFNGMKLSGSDFAIEQNDAHQLFRPLFEAAGKQPEKEAMPAYATLVLKFVKLHPNGKYAASIVDKLANYFIREQTFSFEILNEVYGTLKPEARTRNIGLMLDMTMKMIINGQNASVGKMAPPFSLPDSTGKKVSLSDFKGKYVLLDFWASWCGACKASFPFMKELYSKFKNNQFETICISIDGNKDAWLKESRKQQLPWVSLLDMPQNDYAISMKNYGLTSIPATFLLDPEGKIIAKEIGMNSSEDNPILVKLKTIFKD